MGNLYPETIAYFKKHNLADFAMLMFLGIYPFSVKFSLVCLTIHFLLTARSNYRGIVFNMHHEAVLIAACVIFYLLHVISLGYSFNFHSGLKDIETKFGFFIFPVLALLVPRTKIQRIHFLKYFVFAFALASVVCLLRSCYNFLITADTAVLFYDQFSYLMHPTYFTMHLSIAIIFHFYLCYAGNANWNYINSDFIKKTISCIFIVAIFMTASRAGILIAMLSSVLLLSGKVLKIGKVSMKSKFTFGIVSIIMMLFLFIGTSRFSIIVNELSGKAQTEEENVHSAVDESPVAHRVTLMKVAAKVAVKHPFGVGAGDVQDVLVEEYKQIGYDKAVIVRYNPHNQYLQSAVALGFPGVFILVILFGALFWSIRSSEQGKLLFFLGLILALNGLFESVFEVQRGVLLLTIIVAFVIRMERSENSIKT